LSFELLIRGSVGLDGLPLELAITDGTIVAVGAELELDTLEEIDANGLTVMAGGIDPHVHFNEPGFRAEWEGWETGSAAAAAGGITTVVEMPLNAHPPTIDVESFDLKVAVASECSLIDFALWGGIVPGNLAAIGPLAERGVIGFKAFMSASGVDDFMAVDDLTLYEAMREIAPLGLPVALHAESDVITLGLAARARDEDRVTMRDYLDSRPAVAETQAIARAIELAANAGCALHIVHTSTARGVRLVAEARAAGLDVSCEVTPHNLILTDEDAEALGAAAKCAPPLRSRAETEALWGAVAADQVAFVGSDHSPSPPELKAGEDAFSAWGGISGVQTLLEAMLTEGRARLTPDLLARLLGGACAERLALKGKGALRIGADADVTLIELGPARRLRARELRYRHPYSAWVGRELTARVRRTVLRGETVYLDGELTGGPGGGRLVTPGRPPAALDSSPSRKQGSDA
jgi:allantoinase